jgi:type I restriction-modification system DNA methylase subunit
VTNSVSLSDLVERFLANEDDYKSPSYKEHRLRIEFINPLFELLGWDVSNSHGYAEAYKDVVHEDTVSVAGGLKAPDYSFRIGGTRKFFVEAKAPSINIGLDPASAFQLRRYGWSAKLPMCILTNFAELAVYDCRFKPESSDKASDARVLRYEVANYLDQWSEIESTFSREAVLKGSFDRFATDQKQKRGTQEVDAAFLLEIEAWREALAKTIARNNPNLSLDQLNYVVQRTIDRIIFLRIAEDRGIEPYGRLRNLAKEKAIYSALTRVFESADARYNSGLFHFNDEEGYNSRPDRLSLGLNIPNTTIGPILTGLYYPKSPYVFSALSADILGQVYEQFLGKVISVSRGSAVIEDKPEVKKAGGVYYTPTYIVQEIVAAAVGPFLADASLSDIEGTGRRAGAVPFRILDPACGSGSFLIEAYQALLDWYLDAYVKAGPTSFATGRQRRLYQDHRREWRLTIAERKRILLTHIYGVDLDPQAVEVTKLSLLLKVLEGEGGDNLASQLDFFQTRVLPDLGKNIKCGNSLVELDIIPHFVDQMVDPDEVHRNKPFDWQDEFPFLRNERGFSAIIGNPPYIDSEWMTKHWPFERRYCSEKYSYASGNWDIFCTFIGKSVDLLRPHGRLSMIVPNKLMTADYAKAIRSYMLDRGAVETIRDYSSIPVFPVAVYPIIFHFVRDKEQSTTRYESVLVKPLDHERGHRQLKTGALQVVKGSDPWSLGARPTDGGQSGMVPLGSVADVRDSATVAEAYLLKDLLEDCEDPGPDDLKLVNSGTIDPYQSLWGMKRTRYVGLALMHPVLPSRRINRFPSQRINLAEKPKLLVANMTQRLEAFYDDVGDVIGGKSVTTIDTDYNPYVLLAILNSDYMTKLYRDRFHGRILAGGYIQVAPAALRDLPILASPPPSAAARIENFVRRLIASSGQLSRAAGPSETVLERETLSLRREIEGMVEALYGSSQ